MNIVYIHGLDSDANSTKGALLDRYCQQYHPDIKVHRPDLNDAPDKVFEKLVVLIKELNKGAPTVLVGSSLGGYFSTLISNHMGCPALLLNPSTQPHITLQRFSNPSMSDDVKSHKNVSQQILHITSGGWTITAADLTWFADHQLLAVNYPKKVAVFIKQSDELLDPNLSAAFFRQHGATVTLQNGGDHRFSDFAEQLPMVIKTLQQLSHL